MNLEEQCSNLYNLVYQRYGSAYRFQKETGIHRQYISRLKNNPSLANLWMVAKVMNMKVILKPVIKEGEE
ncbi:helix-turn-helix domain-containing protein [Kluyvera genomosp. 3]|uniref:Helix-turn-helix transcriptional regulator n=1 Tax=Kluyvera genomosp. 3 TaxID=2774055 RepID=A0A6G9RN65_9ENTR|nr:helix-turn-helix transcriptional regulator [Kluyvera genomosp. 3]QIR27727.1 helix-turn-helix transcriptional regulator [Kluyvera genomosp. 3]